jgi:DNA-binding CsgD family transcriptional regulator
MDGRQPAIVGRRAELDEIDRLLGAEGSGASAVLLDGEAGIGKTTVWLSGVEEARRRGLTVLVARPVEVEMSLPFAALGDLLEPVAEPYSSELPEQQRRALFHALQRADTAEPVDRLALARAVAELLRVVAAARVLLIAVDDVQWLDAPTEHVLAFAFRRLADSPARLLLARRSDGSPPAPLGLDRAPFAVRQVSLQPLDLSELGALLADRLELQLPRPRLLELHRACGGNPFYALEIGRMLQRSPDDEGVPVPESLGELLRGRLDTLSGGARAALLFAAASMQPTSGLIERATGGTRGLGDAVHAGVLQLDGDRIRFSHPLLAAVVYRSAAPWDRRAAHRRLVDAATDREERARHLALATDEPDEATAAELEAAAAHASSRGAPETAATFMERAAALSPAVEESRRRLAAAADHHIACGDTVRARAMLEQLVADLPPSPERADLLRQLSDVGDTHAESIALCEQALVEAAGSATVTTAVHLQLATLTAVSGDLIRSTEHTRAAVRFAEEAGDDALVATTIAELCSMLMYLGLPYPPEEMDRALELERRLGGIPVYQNPSYRYGTMLANADLPERGRPLLRAGLERLEQTGNAVWQIGPLFRLADLELRAGNWGEAARLARRAANIAQNAGIAQEQSIAFMSHGLVQAHLGNIDEARDAAGRALATAEAAGDRGYATRAAGALGFAELSAGDYRAALAHLEPAFAELRRMGVGELSIHHVAQNLVEALVAVGRLDDAEAAIAYVEEKGRPTERSWHAAIAARGRALVAAARGDTESADAWIERALAAHERLPQPFELGRTLLAKGTIDRRAKRRTAAREALTQALEVFDGLGAALWAERAGSELARIPGRGRAAGELTETERRVAELVAQGLSNKEVAAALFVSVRAVEANLSKVYAKLGIRSRTQLAGRL